MNSFPNGDTHGPLENRPVIDESVEFSIFPAGIHMGRQVPDKFCVNRAPGKIGLEFFSIDARKECSKTQINEDANQFFGVPVPEGEKGFHSHPCEIPFTVFP